MGCGLSVNQNAAANQPETIHLETKKYDGSSDKANSSTRPDNSVLPRPHESADEIAKSASTKENEEIGKSNNFKSSSTGKLTSSESKSMSKLNAPQGKRVNIAESNAVLNANMTISERVQLMFDKYDTDGSGKINVKEFRNLTMDMGYYFTDEELEMQLRVFDTKTDGELEFKEVLEWYKTDARFKKALVGPSTLRKVEKLSIQFKKFDRDNSGEIDALEFNALYDALTKIGFVGNKNDVRRQLDKTGDGKISFNEFVQFFLENTK